MLRSLSHDTKKCDTHVYTSFFQQLIRQKQLGNWPNTYVNRLQKLANRRLAKRLVGETTVNPTEHTEGAFIWLTSALIDKLSELRVNLTLMFAIQCFFSTLGRQFLYHYLSSVSHYFIVISLQACNRPQQTPACQTHLWNHSTIIEKRNTPFYKYRGYGFIFYFLKNCR